MLIDAVNIDMDAVDVNYDAYETISVGLTIVLPDRSNPLEEFSDSSFEHHFRLNKSTFNDLLHELNLQVIRNSSIPPVLQLAVTLQFYATGSYQYILGDLRKLSQPSVCRIIRRVYRRIAALSKKYIKFPQSPEKIKEVTEKFREKVRIPCIIGAIDSTHVRIKRPTQNGHLFYNRKGLYPSLYVQFVSTNDYEFSNVVSRYPGSAHDSRIPGI